MYKVGSRCEVKCSRLIARMRYVKYRANPHTQKSEIKCAADDFEIVADLADCAADDSDMQQMARPDYVPV